MPWRFRHPNSKNMGLSKAWEDVDKEYNKLEEGWDERKEFKQNLKNICYNRNQYITVTARTE